MHVRGEATAEQSAAARTSAGIAEEFVAAAADSAEAGGVVASIVRDQALSSVELSVYDYLTLVDLTGRVLGPAKRGDKDPRLPTMLSRSDLKREACVATMNGWRQTHGRALGHPAVRVDMAKYHGVRWIKNRCPLFVHRAAA